MGGRGSQKLTPSESRWSQKVPGVTNSYGVIKKLQIAAYRQFVLVLGNCLMLISFNFVAQDLQIVNLLYQYKSQSIN